jgi:hypothetical protein
MSKKGYERWPKSGLHSGGVRLRNDSLQRHLAVRVNTSDSGII